MGIVVRGCNGQRSVNLLNVIALTKNNLADCFLAKDGCGWLHRRSGAKCCRFVRHFASTSEIEVAVLVGRRLARQNETSSCS
ncbi:unnamed protein product [Haemonchus placei]|uniref:Uncharacterized protein n=1 Tax=Haemonchus placei TaxID=6290 RepID=A0A0N4WBV4_HAEPC|nr:unnamed protein product [Haemonchus placei]